MHHQMELIWSVPFALDLLFLDTFQGALLGLAYFIFDGIGAYFAVPELLDPTFDTAALLGLGALHAMLGRYPCGNCRVYFTSRHCRSTSVSALQLLLLLD